MQNNDEIKLPGIVNFRLCTLTDDELTKAVADHICEMYKMPFKLPPRSIPAKPNKDFDLLLGELIVRFIEKSKP